MFHFSLISVKKNHNFSFIAQLAKSYICNIPNAHTVITHFVTPGAIEICIAASAMEGRYCLMPSFSFISAHMQNYERSYHSLKCPSKGK